MRRDEFPLVEKYAQDEDDYDRGRDCGLSMAIEIIDKYEEESEEK